jgi:hypothetical protein
MISQAHTILDADKFAALATFPALDQGSLLGPQTMILLASELTPRLALSLDTAFFGPRQYYFLLLSRFRKLVPALLW